MLKRGRLHLASSSPPAWMLAWQWGAARPINSILPILPTGEICDAHVKITVKHGVVHYLYVRLPAVKLIVSPFTVWRWYRSLNTPLPKPACSARAGSWCLSPWPAWVGRIWRGERAVLTAKAVCDLGLQWVILLGNNRSSHRFVVLPHAISSGTAEKGTRDQ